MKLPDGRPNSGALSDPIQISQLQDEFNVLTEERARLTEVDHPGTRSPAKTDSRAVAVLKLSRVRFLGRDRWRHTGAVRASAKIAKNRSEQVPPRHRVGTYLTYCRTTRGIASSRKKGVCVNYPHSLNVRSGIPGSNVLAPEARRAIALRV